MGANAKKVGRISWEQFVEGCTPGLWRLKVVSRQLAQPGTPVRTSIPFPDDRNVEAGIARAGHPAGEYSVFGEYIKTKGESYAVERKKLGMAQSAQLSLQIVHVSRELAQAPPVNVKGPVDLARAESEAAKFEAATAEAKAKKKEAEKKIERLEREDGESQSSLVQTLLSKLDQPRSDPIAAILPLLLATMEKTSEQNSKSLERQLEREREDRDRSEKMLLAMMEQKERPAGSNPLKSLQDSLQLFQSVKELVTSGLPEGDGGQKSEMREMFDMAKEALGAFLEMRRPKMAAPAPVAEGNRIAPVVNGHAAAPASVPMRKPGHERVEQFLDVVCRECAVDADPVVVADKLAAEGVIGVLPGAVRIPLEAGDWSEAWIQCQPFLTKEQTDLLAPMMTEGVMAWCDRFAVALTEEPEGA